MRSPTPQPTWSACSGCVVCMPQQLTNYMPHGNMSLAHIPPCTPTPPKHNDCSTTPNPIENHSPDPQPHPFQTHTNKLGIFRWYMHAPTWYPRHKETLDLVCDSQTSDIQPPSTHTETIHELSHDTPYPMHHSLTLLLLHSWPCISLRWIQNLRSMQPLWPR